MKKSNLRNKILDTSTNVFNKETGLWENVDKSNFERYVCSNFSTIKTMRKLNSTKWEITEIVADNSANRGHIGCAILSMSKRIMNEVFDVANTNKLNMYYQDTDSIHMDLDAVPVLEDKYREIYHRELNGKGLGQFHGDFKLDDAEGEIYSERSIFLGKKSYLDCLVSVDKNGNRITGYHKRMKGITEEGLEHSAKKYTESYLGLYKHLAQGHSEKIILNPFNADENKQKVLFKFKDGTVSTKTEFVRLVKF